MGSSVVLLHGGGTTARQWDLVTSRLAAPALALDVPGRGDRPADLERLSLPQALDSLTADSIIPLAAGHLPHVTMPEAIAALCDGVAADVDRRERLSAPA